MGFFDTLKEIASDVKEISKKTTADYIVEYIENGRYDNYSFNQLLGELYGSGVGKGFYKYASYIVLMQKYSFYDPYIKKKIKVGVYGYGIDKNHRYYIENIERKLEEKYKKLLADYDFEELSNLVEQYEKNSTDYFRCNESTYYFTYAKDKDKLVNHYSCVAAANLIEEKSGVAVEYSDLSDENDDDIRAKKNKERMEKAGKVALKAAATIVDRYAPADEEGEDK